MSRHVTTGFEWSFRDALISLIIVFIAAAALAITMVPKAAENLTPGKLIVQLYWDNTIDADVDLWVMGPGDHPVGYSSRSGEVFSLLRDHRGYHIDGDYSNTEFAVARKLPEGVYIVNAALYSSWDHKFPVHVWVKVQLIDDDMIPRDLYRAEAMLTAVSEERTLLQFRIGEDGKPVDGSQNSLQQRLWEK